MARKSNSDRVSANEVLFSALRFAYPKLSKRDATAIAGMIPELIKRIKVERDLSEQEFTAAQRILAEFKATSQEGIERLADTLMSPRIARRARLVKKIKKRNYRQ